MSTPINSTATEAAHENFQTELDMLVLLLQASNEVPEMAEPSLLREMIGALQTGTSAAGLPGVGDLLRSWNAALNDLTRSGGGFAQDDLLKMAMWFMSLQEHASGRLDAAGREMLAQLPEDIRWLPRMSPAFTRQIARRLEPAAILFADASSSSKVVDAAHAAPIMHTINTADAASDIAPSADTPSGPHAVVEAHATEAGAAETHATHPATDYTINDLGAYKAVTAAEYAAIGYAPEQFTPQVVEHGDHTSIAALTNAFVIPETPITAKETGHEFTSYVEDPIGNTADAPVMPTGSERTDATDDSTERSADNSTTPPIDVEYSAHNATIGTSHNTITDQSAIGFDDADFMIGLEDSTNDAAADTHHAASTAPIWIGQDELTITRQAIVEQLIPLAQAWADTPDADANAVIMEELAYQSQLIVNVLELIGMPALARGMDAVRSGVEQRDPAVTPEAVVIWCNVLLATMEEPGDEAAEVLTLAAQDLPGLNAAWEIALAQELSRVQIGMDPALRAERKTQATPDDVLLAPADDVVPSVLDGMLRELPGNAAKLGAAVRGLTGGLTDDSALESDNAHIDEARRVAHTLKGDANTVGVRGLANLTHALEDILIVLAKRPELLNADCADLLTASSDCIEEITDHLLGRGPAPTSLLDLYQHVLDTANALADGADAVPAAMPASRTETTPTTSKPPADSKIDSTITNTIDGEISNDSGDATLIDTSPAKTAAPAIPAVQAGMAASGIQSLNVPSTLLDELQRLAGETLVTARQIDQQLDGLGGLYRDQRVGVRNTQELISRLDDLVALRGAALQSTAQKEGAELDPLEIDQYNELHVISRQLLEAHADSGEFMRRIERTMNALSDLRNEQELLNRDMQRNIQRTRTVPFGQISARLQRIVRQTAKQVMKPVQLDLIGEDIPLDAELLERIVEPLAHLLRNAIDHGIEAPEQRQRAGKAEQGRIVVRVGLQGDAAMIEINDDGRGLDLDAIRTRALAAGLITEQQAGDERLLTRMILLPGFSTRSSASEVSGRGIGMDVVNQRIAALRGVMTITSEWGRGMRVQLRLPVTQTLANVIVARGQRQVSAVVSASVERVVSYAAGECVYDNVTGRLLVMLGDEPVPAVPIETFYGEATDANVWLNASGVGLQVRDTDGKVTVVLVRSIDEVRSTVVKPISAYLPPIPAVRGMTQLGDGGLAPVIDLDVMLESSREHPMDLGKLSLSETATITRVVVADDSLSVRRALEQLMEDAGFEVATARDGFEALAAIQAKPTHALLVDMEMPRMNGLEVTRNLRTHAETRDLPVVMITSRTTDKHQTMAEQAGVTRMLGKPFSEDSLVALVRELIAHRISESAAEAAVE